MTQDPIEQALDKLGSYGVPVNEIGEKVGGLVGQIGSFDLFEIMEQVGSIDPSQIDVGEMLGELKERFDELDPALKVPVAGRRRLRRRSGGEVDCPLAATAAARGRRARIVDARAHVPARART